MYRIQIEDATYPELLKEISKPPKTLYCMGDIRLLQAERKVAVVGTRTATDYGKLCCQKLVSTLCSANVVTVSGLALGIDAICQEATLNLKGKTIAVVGSGLDEIYPKQNTNLWKRVAKEGLLVSEYLLGMKAFPKNFPERNRIITGLSQAVVVVESKERGGSLITAELALEENRDVYAIPGDIDSPCSRGCNQLIRDSQAKLLAKMEEILYDYGWSREVEMEIMPEVSSLSRKILASLLREKSLDELEKELLCSKQELLSQLMELEIEGWIKSISGGKFKKIK
ncbi:DNA-processing protein DprA [Fusobacterium necrophorum]|uniref:DNA-processing protein DprA n=1 Tax=Fusobacterium necrophorum TaxID=859 RepID=UPI0007871690|nr:DNA-processing protein DprA [Fusobacterium necrophorum]KYM43308.1 DNA processing protein DprA [Fusobacterium necrophorum subsp. funduliforme]